MWLEVLRLDWGEQLLSVVWAVMYGELWEHDFWLFSAGCLVGPEGIGSLVGCA